MMVSKNVSLQPYNTFGFDVAAKEFVTVHNEEDLSLLFKNRGAGFGQDSLLVLGGGSNLLLTKDWSGLVVKNEILGHSIVSETENDVLVRFGAGEVWHDMVLLSIEKGWAGIENLSLIPGTIGAAPIQNIGAYGVELKDVFVELTAFDIQTGNTRTFTKEDCEFDYRWSVFKGESKGKYVVSSVVLSFAKKAEVKTSYGAIQQVLEAKNITAPTIKNVSDAVIEIRESKLPDPKKIGNSGSFFKNPVISKEQFLGLKAKYPNMASYPVSDALVKVPAGWLIDNAGWKGKTFGEVGVHKNQALVLVNYGKGKGRDVAKLAKEIQQDIKTTYGIDLECEVNIL